MRGSGCRKCFNDKNSKTFKLSTDEVLFRLKKIYKDEYVYPDFSFNNLKDKFTVICQKHGEFLIPIEYHLRGSSCPLCRVRQMHTTNSYISKASEIHNNKYNYSKTKYINSDSKIDIICKEHGLFKQRASSHLAGRGCSKCHNRNFTKENWCSIAMKNKKATLYIINCYNDCENFIKIGITSNSVKYRFSSDKIPYNYNVIKIIHSNPEHIWDTEEYIHNNFKKYSYKPLIRFNGFTECYDKNILSSLYDKL